MRSPRGERRFPPSASFREALAGPNSGPPDARGFIRAPPIYWPVTPTRLLPGWLFQTANQGGAELPAMQERGITVPTNRRVALRNRFCGTQRFAAPRDLSAVA